MNGNLYFQPKRLVTTHTSGRYQPMQQIHCRSSNSMSAFFGLAVFLAVTGDVSAQQKQRELPEQYILEPVRVHYATKGEDAVPPDDGDRSGVPDRVEDMAKQVWAAHYLFCRVLKFPDPIGSERYPKVTCITVSMRNLGGRGGLAFDASQPARQTPGSKSTDRTLPIRVSCTLNAAKGGTPAHETFHLVQYGATYFKNPWYLEGMARWSEHALGREGLGPVKYSPDGPWPQKLQHQAQLVQMKYDAEHVLWNPIARRTDRSGLLSRTALGKKLTSLRYSDGSPVLRDRSLYGADIMREIVLELGKQDDIAFQELKYDRWSEKNQLAETNNPYIYRAVMDVLRRRFSSVGPYEVPGADRRRDGKMAASDHFAVGSVWKGMSKTAEFTLTVLEVQDGRFRAKFESRNWEKEVSGTSTGDSVSWKAKDVKAIRGGVGGDNDGTIVRDDDGVRIDFVWRGKNNQGKFTLRKQK